MHGWSPQQIAGRMRLERHPISVIHETIYRFAYSADGYAIKLCDTCRSIVPGVDRRMPDASMANDLAGSERLAPSDMA